MSDKIQRFRAGHFGMQADSDGDFVSVNDVDELTEVARDILFDGPRSREFEDGVNALLNLIKLGQ